MAVGVRFCDGAGGSSVKKRWIFSENEGQLVRIPCGFLTPEVDGQEFHVEMLTPEVDGQEFHVEMLTSFAKSVQKTCVAPRIVYFYAQNFFVRTFFPTFANIIIKYKRL